MKTKTEYFPLMTLRENLRVEATALTNRMARSVGRLTSCDLLPCEEYAEEVDYQRQLAQQVFYLQNCRAALEQCICNGATAVRYRWPDGTVTMTRFRMVTPSRVKVSGLRRSAILCAKDAS